MAPHLAKTNRLDMIKAQSNSATIKGPIMPVVIIPFGIVLGIVAVVSAGFIIIGAIIIGMALIYGLFSMLAKPFEPRSDIKHLSENDIMNHISENVPCAFFYRFDKDTKLIKVSLELPDIYKTINRKEQEFLDAVRANPYRARGLEHLRQIEGVGYDSFGIQPIQNGFESFDPNAVIKWIKQENQIFESNKPKIQALFQAIQQKRNRSEQTAEELRKIELDKLRRGLSQK